MNKKIKWAIPFAVLALSCGIAAGCKGGGHEHSYTEWGYNETQHWKQCPEDDEIDESSKKAHNFIGGSCECGATQQTPPVTDVTVTNETTDTNGTVTLSKTTVKAGESVTVTVEPKAGYQLKSLTVNGANVFGAMTGNTYEFTVSENTTVVAVFEKIASSSVNSVITGKKYGVTGNSLTAGTDVTLTATGRDDIATEIKADGDNLVIKVDEIAGDNWSVKVDGYVAATIIVPRDAAYTSAIALEYDLMENLSTSWGNYDSVDLSKQNDGKITYAGGYYQWVSTKDSYESVAITANVVKGGFRQGVFIRFKGDKYEDDGFVMVAKENQQKISVCGAGDGYKGKNLWKDNWDEYLNPLAKDEYELTLVRNGANIYIFIDGEYKATKALPEGYADKECYVGLFCTDATKMENSERTFAIQDASEFLEISVTDETAAGAHGTVTIDKPTANLNERVTVTLEPENGYKISDLKIDGVSVLSQMTGNSYTFTALKDTTVVAEFEEKKPLNSLEVTVNAANGFTAEGAKITLEQFGEKQTGTVGANGKVTLGSAEKPVATGTHNVYADFGGYQIKLGTVNVEASDSNDGTAKPVSVTLGFTGSGVEYAGAVSSANPATGELTYKLGKDDNGAYNNKYDIKTIENGGYFAQKISFASMAEAIGTGKKVSMSVILRTANGKEIKFVVQNSGQYFGINGTFCMGLDDNELGGGNGVFVGGDASKFINLGGYKDALLGDGLWIVLGYDAQTGGLVTYAGTELASVRPVKTWGTLPAGLKFTGIGTGKWFDDGLNADLVKVTLKYGATMEAIGMAIEEKVTVTASVNDEAMGTVALDATDGKYFSGTQVTVTVTANAGYVLKSIQVGDDEAVTEGWTTDGNVYTYTFTVSASNTAVVATFEDLQVWESATLTLNGVAENTEVKLFDGLDTITATADANGVVTFTDNNKISKKVYTVTVGDVVFNVDFTTESSIRKTIATVTVDDFQAKDNYNEGAKVIDMGGAKNSTDYVVTFNLKTNSTAAGWQQRWSLLLINGDGSTTTGIGCIGKNDDQLLVWAANGASPDDKNPTKYGEAKYLKFDELVHGANGVNMKVVRHGSKATMYFESEGEWIEMLSVTLGSGETNLKFSCSYGVEWQISDMAINYVSEFDYLVNASIEGDAHGYKVNVVQTAGRATVVIQTNNPDAAWSYFPNAITVNGKQIDFSTVTKESLGANRCKYTFTLDITENTDIVVTVDKGTLVDYNASVNDDAMGKIECDMEINYNSTDYYWNDLCTITVTANAEYELESIVIGEGDTQVTITEDSENGWTQNGKVYTYRYLVTGDIKVVAKLKHTPVVTLNNVTVSIMNGTDKVDLGERINAKLDGDTDYSVILTKGADGTYTFGGTFLCGNYKLIVLGQNVGYSPVDVVIDENTAAVSVQYLLATATKYHHGDNNGMGECDFETLIEVDANTVKINTANANGKPVDAFWCWNSSVPEVTLNVSEEVKNATNVTLEFNLKVANGNNSPNNAFGIAMAGYKGVAISLWNINDDKIDLHELTGCKLGTDGWGYADTYAAFGWIETLAESANGVNIRVVRKGAKITFYAQNTAIAEGEQWVQFFETTCDESAKTDIKFLGMGSDYTVADISVTVNETSNEA